MKINIQLSILLSVINLLLVTHIHAQTRDALTATHNCNPNCIDLKIGAGYPNYDVEWQVYDAASNTYTTVAGWPKSGLAGNDGTEDLCNPTATTYHAIVHDALCGEADLYYTVEPCKCGTLEVIIESVTNVSACGNNDPEEGSPAYDNCDGSASVSASGIGNSNPTFSWSNGMIGASVGGLCTGSYTVTVTSTAGCTSSAEIIICCCNSTSPTSGAYPLCGSSPTITDADLISPTSSTAADGSISLITSGSSQPSNVKYKWEGPNGFKSNSKNIAGLKVGNYCVTLTDGCSSPVSKCYTLIDCSNVQLFAEVTTTSTCGDLSFGKIALNITNGTAPYKYKWQAGFSTQNLKTLAAGQYCVTVSDYSGCTLDFCANVGSDGVVWDQILTCYTKYFCNLDFMYSISGNIVPKLVGCRTIEETCDLNGAVLLTKQIPYASTRIDINQCAKYGRCPHNFQEELIALGTIKIEHVYIKMPLCNCYECWETIYCVVDGDVIIKSSNRVNVAFCGPPPGGLVDTQSDETNISIEALMYQMRADSLIHDTLSFVLPVGVNQKMLSNEYKIKLDSLVLNSDDGKIEYYRIGKNNELTELDCENKICISIDSLDRRYSNTNIFSVSLSPNPFKDNIELSINNSFGKVEIYVRSIDGKLMFKKSIKNLKNADQVIMELNILPSGLYILSIEDVVLKKIINHKIVKT